MKPFKPTSIHQWRRSLNVYSSIDCICVFVWEEPLNDVGDSLVCWWRLCWANHFGAFILFYFYSSRISNYVHFIWFRWTCRVKVVIYDLRLCNINRFVSLGFFVGPNIRGSVLWSWQTAMALFLIEIGECSLNIPLYNIFRVFYWSLSRKPILD